MPEISFAPVTDAAALAGRWRGLEPACDGGFFRSWTWLGALLPHFGAPHLLAVRDRGQDVALGLFNRVGGRLLLHEAGAQPWDGLYVEHNGLLLRRGAEAVLPAALRLAVAQGRLVLSGIDDAHARAAALAGEVQMRGLHFAPALDLAALARSGRPHLDVVSGNARSQIRRAMRLYGARLAIEHARTAQEARDFFARLVALHQAAWRARGKPGAFADGAVRAFHDTLIAAGVPRGEVLVARIAAGAREIGYLYNFQHGGRVFAYQSGFVAEADARLKPGLVCHALAIADAMAAGARVYDFLAGAQRYKTTLAPQGGEALHWITLHRAGSMSARVQRVLRAVRS
jgi:CelD/BcsL family acetyltransferase involved in cellulose biosynthesis